MMTFGMMARARAGVLYSKSLLVIILCIVANSLSLFTFMHWRRKWQPTPVFLPGESQGRGSLVGCTEPGVAQSQTQLRQLSSSSNSVYICQLLNDMVLLTVSLCRVGMRV